MYKPQNSGWDRYKKIHIIDTLRWFDPALQPRQVSECLTEAEPAPNCQPNINPVSSCQLPVNQCGLVVLVEKIKFIFYLLTEYYRSL